MAIILVYIHAATDKVLGSSAAYYIEVQSGVLKTFLEHSEISIYCYETINNAS